MLGTAATTNSLEELGHSDVILVDAIDLARRLPTVAGAVIRAKLNGARLIVVGSRSHRVSELADFFLRIKPNTEALLYSAMAKVIEDRGLMNLSFIKSRCRDYESFVEQLRSSDLVQAADGCGVSWDLIEAAALAYAGARSAAILYSSSMGEKSEQNIRALINLVLLTGNLGKRGAGIFALAEQNNLQGVCDIGVLPDRLPGYASASGAGSRAMVERVWRSSTPAVPGLAARSILTDRGGGKVKALWLSRYDPATTAFFPGIEDSLRALELYRGAASVHDRYRAICARDSADNRFWRRAGFFYQHRAAHSNGRKSNRPAGRTTPGWKQLTRLPNLGRRLEVSIRGRGDAGDRRSHSVLSGASYENLARDYGRQWPCTKDKPLGTPILFADDDGARFKFVPVQPEERFAAPKNLPLMLVFGHSFITGTRTC